MHKCHMIMDLQYGSTGKGLIAGYLAKREDYDTAVCAFASNAGHTYIDESRGIHVMTQQLPTALTSPTVKNLMIGPGAAIHAQTLYDEILRYSHLIKDKRIMIHPHAAVVEDYHTEAEVAFGMTKMGSTAKGVGEAYIERIRRDPIDPNTAVNRFSLNSPATVDGIYINEFLAQFVVTEEEYRRTLDQAQSVIVEGAQGFSLSMYHGQYPYTTSRDVTPWQLAADCGLPMRWAPYIQVIGTLRTYPIRVNNRDGSSGPCYPDQQEITWESLGIEPELTTVTKLPRRIFTFSQQQLAEAMFHCGGYWNTKLFLNFANYMNGPEVNALINEIERPTEFKMNPPKVIWLGFGADDKDIAIRGDHK